MGRDRSLDEFFGGGAGDDGAEDGVRAGSEDESGTPASSEDDPAVDAAEASEARADDPTDGDEEGPPDAAAVDPATPTYRWTPEGATCESCGRAVERRWADDGGFVCDDCKEW